jgi:Rad3-related DNA helicase
VLRRWARNLNVPALPPRLVLVDGIPFVQPGVPVSAAGTDAVARKADAA